MTEQLMGFIVIVLAFGATVVGAGYVFAVTADREQQAPTPGEATMSQRAGLSQRAGR